MAKIKIGYVINDLTVGGVTKVVVNLCNSLDKERFNVHLFVLSDRLEMLQMLELDKAVKMHIVHYPFVTDYSLKTYLKNSFFLSETKKRATELLQLINTYSIDILHFHTLPRQLSIGILAKQQNPTLQLIFTDHLLRFPKWQYKPHQEFLLSLAYRRLYIHYHLIAVSKTVYNSLKGKSFTGPDKTLALLENTINLKEYGFKNQNNKDDREVLIYISRMNSHKGHDTLIKAWQLVKKKPNDVLYIIGPDETNGKFHEMANGDESIIFTGSIGNLHQYLSIATIGVFPSQKEGLPISLLEMMAYDLPIVVSDIHELTSVIENEVEGLHFALDNVEDLKKQLELLMNSPQLASRLGSNAKKKVEKICLENDLQQFHETFYAGLSTVAL